MANDSGRYSWKIVHSLSPLSLKRRVYMYLMAVTVNHWEISILRGWWRACSRVCVKASVLHLEITFLYSESEKEKEDFGE
jgi:hypothetical protein